MIAKAALLFLLVSTGGPILAQDAAPATTSVAADTTTNMTATAVPPVAAKPRLICRSFTPIGSRLGTKKQCLTVEQWRAQGFETGRNLDAARAR